MLSDWFSAALQTSRKCERYTEYVKYMNDTEFKIYQITKKGLDKFFEYLDDHLSDNGKANTSFFQPLSSKHSKLSEEMKESFNIGLSIQVGHPGWRRIWVATDQSNEVLGHIDLRAHKEKYTEHRALLGMGVDRNCRRKGLGKKLILKAASWALSETSIEWIDLWVLSGNIPANQLYKSTGFNKQGEIEDMFRIEGSSHSYTLMTKRISV